MILPFAVNEDDDDAAGKAGEESAPGIPPRLHILLAEDNEVNRDVLMKLLQHAGHTVDLAADGFEAVTKWEQGHFDVILMDIQMPVVDGTEATSLIRRQEAGSPRHTPIIALTAHALRGDREKFIHHGFDGYVPKPMKFKELNEEIRRCLGGSV